MTFPLLSRALAGTLFLSASVLAVQAQEAAPPAPEVAEPAAAPADPAAVIARVGSSEITEGDLAAAAADLSAQFQQLPPEQRRVALLAALVDIRSLSLQAEEAGLQDDALTERRIAFLRDRALHNAYFERNGVETITDEELRARYDEEVAATEPVEEVHARHILVPTREEAEALITELDGGAEFEALASEHSSDPGSGQRGGDLGFFGPGQMVPAFEAAAYALEPGSYTPEPVESQFGWHIIEVLEKRMAEPPAFEQVREQVRQLLMREKYIELVEAARENLTVEYLDPEMETQIRAMEAAIAGADAEGAGEAAADEAAQEEAPVPAGEPAPAD
ncbi:peptidylprolyl isomerase [Aureimonas populi]|uniref:Parvulin-like PPIase n=1 Tax=Aureimonas populi TaxID=1701758 RepID=A0ABW5CKQ1_9HYPH|nr:peptidylprolyl isomerase [Aureimonas populi]